MTAWANNKLTQVYDQYIQNLIKASQMVEEGLLNSTNFRKLVSEVYEQHKYNVRVVYEIDAMEITA